MRSVVNVRKHLMLSTIDKAYDIITITETWLKEWHKNNEFISDSYNVFRKDRVESSIEAERGGGVLIAVRKDVDCDEYSIPEMAELEAVCVRIQLKTGLEYIYCLSIQPKSDISTYAAHIHAIGKLSIKPVDSLIIAGDFSLPMVTWIDNAESMDFLPIIGESEGAEAVIARHVTNSMMEMGLSQMNNMQNASGNVLDLVHTNVPELTVLEKANRLLIPVECSDKAHNALSISIECNPKTFPTHDNQFAASELHGDE